MKARRAEAAWTCVIALLCVMGVSLADPPDYTVEGTWGCYLYVIKDTAGNQPFTLPAQQASCADWGSNAGTTGTACEGTLIKSPVSGGACTTPKVPIHEQFRFDFVLSFDESGNLTNGGNPLNSAETLYSGKLTLSATGQFVSNDLAPNPPIYGQSYFTTTTSNPAPNDRRGYLVADNHESVAPTAKDGCMHLDLRQFSNIKVASYIGTTAQLDEMFLFCYKTSNSQQGGGDGSGPAGGCFISSR